MVWVALGSMVVYGMGGSRWYGDLWCIVMHISCFRIYRPVLDRLQYTKAIKKWLLVLDIVA